MIWTEGATGLGQLPTTGSAYCMLPVKHFGGVEVKPAPLASSTPIWRGR